MINAKFLILIAVLISLTACNNHPVPKINLSESRFFAETGQTVQGDFLYFFEVYGGVNSLGYPLTSEMVADGWTVQYFEKGRLERHPENEAAYRVTVGWLGELLFRRCPPIPFNQQPSAHDNRLYFPQTGHTLSGDFRTYFEANGGTVRFGLPISEPFLWHGQLSQDFQSARFFWTVNNTTPVTLEDIGRVHLLTLSATPFSQAGGVFSIAVSKQEQNIH